MNLAASCDPVEDQRAGDDRQRRPLGLAVGPPPLQERQDLDRLAQAHVVGQDAAEAEPLEVVEPAQPLALIGAQLAVEARGRIERPRLPRTAGGSAGPFRRRRRPGSPAGQPEAHRACRPATS